jgi:hypothetical protein
MRGFDCVPPDDAHNETIHLEAEDDEALLGKAREHVAQYHVALGLTDDQLRGLIAQGAYDVQPAQV